MNNSYCWVRLFFDFNGLDRYWRSVPGLVISIPHPPSSASPPAPPYSSFLRPISFTLLRWHFDAVVTRDP